MRKIWTLSVLTTAAIAMTMIERFHPIGTPGQPWSAAE